MPEVAIVPKNRSSEELAMRDAIEAWGRPRWPDARVMHELVVGACRIDMAFVSPAHLVGVEIKSSRDTLERLGPQEKEFGACIPELWVALAPKWQAESGCLGYHTGVVIVADGKVDHTIRVSASRDYTFERKPTVRMALTVSMLDLLWRSELHAVAARYGAWSSKGKPARQPLIGAIARRLTGDEIVAEVCRELRARPMASQADTPIILPGLTAADLGGASGLFRADPSPPPSRGREARDGKGEARYAIRTLNTTEGHAPLSRPPRLPDQRRSSRARRWPDEALRPDCGWNAAGPQARWRDLHPSRGP